VIYIEPSIQPTLFAALTIPGDGMFYYAKDQSYHDLEIEWRYLSGRFRCRMIFHGTQEVPRKRPLRKWTAWEDGLDRVLGNDDVVRGSIGCPLSLGT
jgi:hypothetical protein